MSDKVLVDKEALAQLLRALNGPEHHIREIQFTRNLPGQVNIIDQLMTDVENAKNQPAVSPSTTVVYTKSEIQAMNLYTQLKGGAMTTQDNPEEGIRFFIDLVNSIREERAVLAIRNR